MKMLNKTLASLLAAGSLFALSQTALAVEDTSGGPAVRRPNLTPSVTKIVAEIRWLHWTTLVVCIVIFIGVLGAMLYSIFKHRKSVGHKPAMFHESTTVEVIWTITPFPIMIGMALSVTKAVITMKDTTNSSLAIKTTNYQRRWGYDYLKGEGEGISFLSTLTTPRDQINNQAPKSNTYLVKIDDELVVPVNRKIRIVTAANNVIHSWMIPALGVKQDAVPGSVRDAWFEAEEVGVCRGQCAELCGRERAFMPIVVHMLSQGDYIKWVDGKKKKMAARADDPNKTYTLEELKSRGGRVYTANCAVCHQPSGKGGSPFPALDGSKIADDPLAGHIGIVLHSKGTIPPWAPALNDVEIAAVVTYECNNWGNHTGDPLRPTQMKDARGGKVPEGGAAKTATTESTDKAAPKRANAAGDRSTG